MRILLICAFAGMWAGGAFAGPDPVFKSNMAVPAGMAFEVWGKAPPKTRVSVAFDWPDAPKAYDTIADGQGDWSVTIEPTPAFSYGQDLVVSFRDKARTEFVFTNITAGAKAPDAILRRQSAAPILTSENVTVVLPGAVPGCVLELARDELAGFLSKAFGKTVRTASAPSASGVSIILGENEWSKRTGISLEGLPRDGYVIKSDLNRIYILGKDSAMATWELLAADSRERDPDKNRWGLSFERGTLHGVYAFLKRNFGVRFYWPGELGTVVPPCEKVTVARGEIRAFPAWRERIYNGRGHVPAELFEKGLETGADVISRQGMRLGLASASIRCCHGLPGLAARFKRTHPEFTARVVRRGEVKRFGLCLSTGIFDAVFDYVKSCEPETVDVMPGDGYVPCACDSCKPWYDDTYSPCAELVWTKTAELAERIKAAGLGTRVRQMLYRPYHHLPSDKVKIPDNLDVTVSISGPFTQSTPSVRDYHDSILRGMYERNGRRRMPLWNYPGKYGPFSIAEAPMSVPHAYADFYGRNAAYIDGAVIDSSTDRYIFNALNIYVFAEMAWNPKVKVDEILDEHYRLMYGPAAGDMKAFLDAFEERWITRIALWGRDEKTGEYWLAGPAKKVVWEEVYSAGFLEDAAKRIDAAAGKVQAGTLEARRIAFIRKYFVENLRVEREAQIAIAAGKAAGCDWTARAWPDAKAVRKGNYGLGNLFDGAVGALADDEKPFAWRPAGKPGTESGFEFSTTNVVRLAGVRMYWRTDAETYALPRTWKVQAKNADGQWADVDGSYPVSGGGADFGAFKTAVEAKNFRVVLMPREGRMLAVREAVPVVASK